jgi:hypothetical protein
LCVSFQGNSECGNSSSMFFIIPQKIQIRRHTGRFP